MATIIKLSERPSAKDLSSAEDKTAAPPPPPQERDDRERMIELEKRYNTVLNTISELTNLEIVMHRGGWREAAAFIGAARFCMVDCLEDIVQQAKS